MHCPHRLADCHATRRATLRLVGVVGTLNVGVLGAVAVRCCSLHTTRLVATRRRALVGEAVGDRRTDATGPASDKKSLVRPACPWPAGPRGAVRTPIRL